LLYVFNDARYLIGPAEPEIFLGRLFKHLHLYQQIVARCRLLSIPEQTDPYQDDVILARHVADLKRFAEIASSNGLF
jgi:hypothetical protein